LASIGAMSVTSQWHHDLRADFGGQRLDALLEGIALIGEGEFGALVRAGLGDAPGD
jgi:hypothetical protein